jgi:hypothetical protein
MLSVMNVIKPSKTKRQVESPSNLLEDILALMLLNDPRKRKKKKKKKSSADEFSSLEILLITASKVSLLKQNTIVMSNYLVRSCISRSQKKGKN